MPLDDNQELFYLVDEHDNVLGSIDRATAHNGSRQLHRTIQIIVFNQNNEILLQKRSMKKDIQPGAWTVSASGHVDYGETYIQAAKRELYEEIGLRADITEVTKFIHNTPEQREMMMIFSAKTHTTNILFDREEINDVVWLPISNIREFLTKHEFTNAGIVALQSLQLID